MYFKRRSINWCLAILSFIFLISACSHLGNVEVQSDGQADKYDDFPVIETFLQDAGPFSYGTTLQSSRFYALEMISPSLTYFIILTPICADTDTGIYKDLSIVASDYNTGFLSDEAVAEKVVQLWETSSHPYAKQFLFRYNNGKGRTLEEINAYMEETKETRVDYSR